MIAYCFYVADSDFYESSSDEDESSDDEENDDSEPPGKMPKLSPDQKMTKQKVKMTQFQEKIVTDWSWENDELPNPFEWPSFESEMLEVIDINRTFFEKGMNSWDDIYDDGYCCMSIKIGGYFPWIMANNGKIH